MYQSQGFVNGQKLKAEHLILMEQGISEAVSFTDQPLSAEQKRKARENIGAVAVHIGPEPPTDPNVLLWIDTDEDADAHINSLIDAKMGVIENGSY